MKRFDDYMRRTYDGNEQRWNRFDMKAVYAEGYSNACQDMCAVIGTKFALTPTTPAEDRSESCPCFACEDASSPPPPEPTR